MKYILTTLLALCSFCLSAQSDTETEVTTEGIMIPRLTTSDREAVPLDNMKNGLLVYDMEEKAFYYSDGASWLPISNGGTSVWVDSVYYASYFGEYIEVGDSSELNIFEERAILTGEFLTFSSTEDKDVMLYGADSITSQSFSGENLILNSTRLEHTDGSTYGRSISSGYETGLIDSGSGDVVHGELTTTSDGGRLTISDFAGNNTILIGNDNGGFLQIKNDTGDTLLMLSSNNINSGGVLELYGSEAKIDLDGLELGYKAGGHTGIDGDIIPYNSTSFDIGNNIVGQHWDKVVANEFVVFSDQRLKEDIKSVDDGSLSKIMQLRPVSYNYLQKVDASQKNHTGLLAQEVQKVFPEAISNIDIDINKDGEIIQTESDHLSMNYLELIPHLIKAIQEQQREIDKLVLQVQTNR